VYLPAVGSRLVWVSKAVEPERIVTVIGWFAGIELKPSNEDNWIVLGNLVAVGLFTVMVTLARVERLPALSRAAAVRVWLVLVRVVVSRGLVIEDEEEVAKTAPSTSRVIVFRPELTCPAMLGSLAEAEKVMVLLTVPELGEVMVTVGGVISGLRLTTRVTGAVTEPLLLVAVRV